MLNYPIFWLSYRNTSPPESLIVQPFYQTHTVTLLSQSLVAYHGTLAEPE